MTNKEKMITLKEEMLKVMVAIANEEKDDEAREEFMRALEYGVEGTAKDADEFKFALDKFWNLYE